MHRELGLPRRPTERVLVAKEYLGDWGRGRPHHATDLMQKIYWGSEEMQKAASEQGWKNRRTRLMVDFIRECGTRTQEECMMVRMCPIGDDWAMEGRREPGSGM